MPAPEIANDPPSEIWCMGLPCVGDAPMDASEVRDLRAQARRLAWRCAGCILAAPLVPLLVGLLAVGLSSGSPGPWSAALIMYGLLLGLPVALLLARDAAHQRKTIRDDIASGRVLRFEGVLQDPGQDQDERQVLRAGGVLTEEPGQVQQLRVFQHSQSVRGTSDRGRVRLLRVTLQHAAQPPGYAWRAQLGPDLVPVGAPEGVRFLQRRLTEGEQEEVRGYIRRLKRPDGGLWVGFVLFGISAFGLIGGWRSGDLSRAPRSEWISGGLMLVVGLATFRAYALRLRYARSLHLDLRAGRAVSAEGWTQEMPSADRKRGRGRRPLENEEFLPVSGALWTMSGRPAEWRDSKHRL